MRNNLSALDSIGFAAGFVEGREKGGTGTTNGTISVYDPHCLLWL